MLYANFIVESVEDIWLEVGKVVSQLAEAYPIWLQVRSAQDTEDDDHDKP